MTLAAEEHEVAGWAEAVEAYFERGWTDGLPVVPATPEAIRPFLAAAGLEPGDIVLTETTRRRSISAEKVAINAVMAGCRPEYMPVLLAALEAMADPAFTLHGAITSTGGSATLVVVNGPIRQRLGFNAGGNVFGPGWRANATHRTRHPAHHAQLSRRAARPARSLDAGTSGQVLATASPSSRKPIPWEPLHVTRGLPREASAVTVFAAEGPHNVLSHYGETAEAVVVALADAMAGLGSFSPGESFIVLAPEHVQILARDGWNKPRLREALYARARRTRADLKRGGKLAGAVEPDDETRWEHRGRGPEDIHIVVAGGGAGGHSAFIPSWSRDRNSLSVTRAIRDPHPRSQTP